MPYILGACAQKSNVVRFKTGCGHDGQFSFCLWMGGKAVLRGHSIADVQGLVVMILRRHGFLRLVMVDIYACYQGEKLSPGGFFQFHMYRVYNSGKPRPKDDGVIA